MRAGITREDILSKKDHLPVRPDDLPRAGNDTQAIAVAIEGQAQVGVLPLYGVDQRGKILRHTGVRVVIGKIAIDLAEKLAYLTADVA